MTNRQRIQLRQSEVRKRLVELNSLDDLTNEQVVELSDLARETQTLETRFQAALLTEQTEPEPDEVELAGIERRLSIRRYIDAAYTHAELDGAEREYNDERNLPYDHVPLDALADLQERADVSTAAPSTLPRTMRPIVPRVFAGSDTAYCGVQMPSVGTGEQSFPVLTGGTTASMVAKDGSHDAAAASFTVTTITPTRMTAAYRMRREDLAVFDFEAALRRDLRQVMQDQMDEQILKGNGTSPNLSGLFNRTSANQISQDSDPTGATDWADYVAFLTDAVDGKFATGLSSVKLLVAPKILEDAIQLYRSTTATDVSMWDWLSANSGGIKISSRAPVADAGDIEKFLTIAPGGLAYAPVWDSFNLIVDPYSGAGAGQIRITAYQQFGFDVARYQGWAIRKIHTG